MHWIIRFIVAHRNASSLVLTTVLSLLLLRADAPQQERVARALTLTVFYPFQFTFKQITRARNIYAENRQLRRDLTEAMTSLALLREGVKENAHLRDMLSFSHNSQYQLISARVIAREPSVQYRSVVLNVGNNAGVEMYMPVVTQRGVVGKVVQVLPHICLVQLLKDPLARTSVMQLDDRSIGILETDNGEDFFIRHRTHVEIDEGDTITTSGLGGIFPKGLAVGTVTTTSKDHDPLFKRTHCKPLVDFDHLEELFVLKLSPQWKSLRTELDSVEFEQ